MSYVQIYKLQNDGTQTVIATCALRDGVVTCEGDQVFISNLEKNGISDSQNTQNNLYPKDGARFLDQLQHTFNSGYLVATNVINDEKK